LDSINEPDADFATVVRPHLQRLYRLAFRLAGSAADAEDLIQELLIKIYKRRDELTSIGALGPWLSRVLYNQFIDNTRRYSRQRLRTVPLDSPQDGQHGLEEVASEEPGPERAAASEFGMRALESALRQLSLEHRAVVLMHDAEGYKLEEIQTITGTPIGTLKSRLHRARARLREILSADGTF
jgi:RNA polymerase sigma factor (sigma-70 family)